MRGPLLRTTRLLLGTIAAGLALASLAPALSSLWWVLELPSHFRVQLLAAAAGCAGLLWLLRAWALVGVSLLLVAVHAWAMLPLWLPEPATARAEAPRLRLLSVNVHTANRDHAAVRALLERLRPDVVGLLEVDAGWLDALAPLERWYPHRVEQPQRNNFGIALWSRFPLEDVEIRALLDPAVPFVVAQLALGARPLALVLAHPVPPAGGGNARLRDRQLEVLARVRHELPGHELVLFGDLNTSPWSPAFARLAHAAGLRNAARGFGFAPTWPTQQPLLMTTIDLCLVSAGVEVLAHRTGPPIGSDHLPLYVEIGLGDGPASGGPPSP